MVKGLVTIQDSGCPRMPKDAQGRASQYELDWKNYSEYQIQLLTAVNQRPES